MRVVQVQSLEHGGPVVGAVDLLRVAAKLFGQAVVLATTALAQRRGVVLEQLFFAQQARVALLADSPLAVGVGQQLVLEEVGEDFHRAGGDAAPIGQLGSQLGVRDFGGQDFAHVAHAGAGLADGAVDVHARSKLGAQVAAAVFEGARNGAQASHG